MKKVIVFLVVIVLLMPFSYSNGGCIKVADDILVQLSSSPLVPVVNKQESFLISFANKEKELVNEEISGKLKITKNNEIILTKDFKIKDGILDLKHTFKNPGLYEIFLDFKIGNKAYMPEDFLIEVIEQKNEFAGRVIFLAVGVIIGITLIYALKIDHITRRQSNKSNNQKFIPAARFKILTKFYDLLSGILGFGSQYRSRVIEELKIPNKNVRVLDAGCGSGSLAIEFKQINPNIEMHGVDADYSILKILEKKLEKYGLNIHYQQAFIQKLPYPNNHFDFVYSSLAFHHLTHNVKQRAMNEIHRVLKKNGLFFLADFGKPEKNFSIYPLWALVFEEGYDNYHGNLPAMLLKSKFRSVKKINEYKHGIIFLTSRK